MPSRNRPLNQSGVTSPEDEWDGTCRRGPTYQHHLTAAEVKTAVAEGMKEAAPVFADIMMAHIKQRTSESVGRYVLHKLLWSLLWAAIVFSAYRAGRE